MAPSEPMNHAQIEFLEEELRWWKEEMEVERPPKKNSGTIAHQVSKLGREVSSQEVGRWFASKVKSAAGRPRASQKTPEQLTILYSSFWEEQYPDVQETIRLMEATRLSKKQVQAWFCQQRKKLEEDPCVYSVPVSEEEQQALTQEAKAQWRAYRQAGGEV